MSIVSNNRMHQWVSKCAIAIGLLALPLTTACEPDPEWTDGQTDFRVEVLSSDAGDLVSLNGDNPDAAIVMESGFQGGQHLNLMVQAENVPTDTEINATIWLDDADGNVLGSSKVQLYFDSYFDEVDGMRQAYYQFANVASPTDKLGDVVTFRVQVVLGFEEVGRGTASAPIRWSSFDQERMSEQDPPG